MSTPEKPFTIKPRSKSEVPERERVSVEPVLESNRVEIEKSTTFFNHISDFLRKISFLQRFFKEDDTTTEMTKLDAAHVVGNDQLRRFRNLFMGCSLDEDYGQVTLSHIGPEKREILNSFLTSAHTVIRVFDTYEALNDDRQHSLLKKKFVSCIDKILVNYQANKFSTTSEELFSSLFTNEVTVAIKAMIHALPMRSRRNIFALLHTIHDVIEYPQFNRWMNLVKSSGDRNPTKLTLDSDNFRCDSLCSQSETDHQNYSARKKGLVVNNFLLFEPNNTSTCLCIRPAKAQNGGYFIPGMLYTMDHTTDNFLSSYLGPWKKRVKIENGTFTFVRALSTKELKKLRVYYRIKKAHNNLKKKEVA